MLKNWEKFVILNTLYVTVFGKYLTQQKNIWLLVSNWVERDVIYMIFLSCIWHIYLYVTHDVDFFWTTIYPYITFDRDVESCPIGVAVSSSHFHLERFCTRTNVCLHSRSAKLHISVTSARKSSHPVWGLCFTSAGLSFARSTQHFVSAVTYPVLFLQDVTISTPAGRSFDSTHSKSAP